MKIRTPGMTTKAIYAVIEGHIAANGPSTYDQIAAANPDVDRLDIRDAIRRLNGRTLHRVGTGTTAVYDLNGGARGAVH